MGLKDKLIVVGNGFDLWQGLNTRYSDFAKYYSVRRDAIMKDLFIRSYEIKYRNDCTQKISDVELLYMYRSRFDEQGLNDVFWSTFEASLGELGDEEISSFDMDEEDLKDLEISVENAKTILTQAFIEWIETIDVAERDALYYFDNTCTFLNFNYTDTLQKRFRIPYEAIHFIHGEATDKESVVFGHSSHPDPPDEILESWWAQSGRMGVAYHIQTLLYITDKGVKENLNLYRNYLLRSGVELEDIKAVYVLGHSFGKVDYEYFRFLVDATRATAAWTISCCNDDDRKRVDEVMKKLKFSNYSTYESIAECLADFKVRGSGLF